MDTIILENVKEYSEEYPVKLIMDTDSNRLCVVSTNEGGHNSTWVDAEHLYTELNKYFKEHNIKENNNGNNL